MYAIDSLRKLFPRAEGQKNSSVTGLIPIELFNKMEASIRPAMREAGLRAMYRGPRNYRYQTMTHRSDAVGVLMYPKR